MHGTPLVPGEGQDGVDGVERGSGDVPIDFEKRSHVHYQYQSFLFDKIRTLVDGFFKQRALPSYSHRRSQAAVSRRNKKTSDQTQRKTTFTYRSSTN